MTANSQLFATDALAADGTSAPAPGWIKSFGQRIVVWVDSCADYLADAAIYQQLSALSDGELARRGLSRGTLAHDLRAACVRNTERGG
jgi:hypothetical protein